MDFFLMFVIACVAFALGYAARKYVEKKWPNEAALMDAVATKYGEDAKSRLQSFLDRQAATSK